MVRHQPDWSGISLKSRDVGARRDTRKFYHRGYYYVNEWEVMVARLLHRQRIPFTPDILFTMTDDDGKQVVWVADFVFDRDAYLWRPRKGDKGMIIHGIEAKGASNTGDFAEKPLLKARLLREQRGIVILLVSNDDIKRWDRKGYLPLERTETP